MDCDALKALSEEVRERYLREQLGSEKCKILDKYNLRSNSRLYWERYQEKYPVQEYFSNKFAMKATPLGMIFHINRLCFAKVKYFEQHWDEYVPCIYDCRKGFIETEIYDMEFIKQKSTGIVIDLRELAKIHWLKDFKDFCAYLEKMQENVLKVV
ncbi:hypothetical protein [Clostridium aciditolerans]|uniref:Uncharacterized protein n=1 Tax=Clostridium aciditolerans TaxID=339861 RepID=A0A934I1M8_9CLOT|nr:hypothetical protein [Clostridium aciditolerans]MBI6875169.1 hypothetical protein [Clostridium aciditolerans]